MVPDIEEHVDAFKQKKKEKKKVAKSKPKTTKVGPLVFFLLSLQNEPETAYDKALKRAEDSIVEERIRREVRKAEEERKREVCSAFKELTSSSGIEEATRRVPGTNGS